MTNPALTPTQLQVHQSTHPRRLVRHGRRWGATALALYEAINYARDNRGHISVIVAPTTDHARAVHLPRIKKMMKTHEWLMADHERMVYVLKNASIIMLVGADDEFALEDISPDYAAIDGADADGMWEYWQEQVRPRMVRDNGPGRALMTFTTTDRYPETDAMDWLFVAETGGYCDAYHFKTAEGYGVSEDMLEQARRDMGKREFETEFEGEWPSRLRRRTH